MRIARLACFGCLAFATALLAPPARALPVQYGSNYYEYVAGAGISWNAAKTAAAAMSFNTAAGHLAIVTSGGENTFLKSLIATFGGFAGAWLGGDVNASGAGFWRVGPENGQQFSQGGGSFGGMYENWGGIEPNNGATGGGPSAAYMNIGPLFAGIATEQWADAALGLSHPSNDPIQGYFVEYEFAAVPEPLGIALLGLAAVAVRRMRRGRAA